MKVKSILVAVLLGVAIGWQLRGLVMIRDVPDASSTSRVQPAGSVTVDQAARTAVIPRQRVAPTAVVPQKQLDENRRGGVDVDSSVTDRERQQLFARIRNLTQTGSTTDALSLLNVFLAENYNDVDGLRLKADIFAAQGDYKNRINALYTAKSYAYQEDVVNKIRLDIRASVDRYQKILQADKNLTELLLLFQDLVYLEPDYSPYFIGLATAQTASGLKVEARQSLQLVMHDASVGGQARQLLAQLIADDQREQEIVAQVEDSSISIPLRRQGHHFIVDAVLNGSTVLSLIIDTGASLTIIKPVHLRVGSGQQAIHSFNTANGVVRAPVVTADSLTIGDFEVMRLQVGGIALDNMPGADGLLGMNFLKHFRFFIDQENNTLRLSLNHGG